MSFVVIGLGELLWDVFPDGKQLGGAPINFACIAAQLGAEAYPVSCIGQDPQGVALRNALSDLYIDHSYIQEDNQKPTGTVQIVLDQAGIPSYEIRNEVAWDAIRFTEKLKQLAKRASAVCFGSLAQRGDVSQKTIYDFLNSTPSKCLRIFDVNLRQDIYTKQIVEDSLKLCNILKLSDEELPILSEWFDLTGPVMGQLKILLEQFDLEMVAYTRGKAGSILVSSETSDEHQGVPTNMVDSVGAGDAFTAALCLGLLNQMQLFDIHKKANAVAAFVCSKKGGTPKVPFEIKKGFIS